MTTAPTPTRAVARHWLLTAVLGLIGLVLGAAVAIAVPQSYTAEARLAVAPERNSAYTIAGFPLAATELAANYARWVQNNTASGQWRPEGVTDVQASPVPDTAVVRVEVEAPDEQAAVNGANSVAQRLERVVGEAQSANDPENAYKAFQDRAAEVADATSEVSAAEAAYGRALAGGSTARTETAKAALDEANAKLSTLKLRQDGDGDLYRRLYADPQGNTTLRVLGEASSMGSDRTSNLQRGAVLGLAVGLILAVPLSMLAERRRRRRETAAAARGV